MMILDGVFIDPWPSLFRLAMELAIYPCMAWLLLKAQHAFLQQV